MRGHVRSADERMGTLMASYVIVLGSAAPAAGGRSISQGSSGEGAEVADNEAAVGHAGEAQ
jgi:hypothetical protein